MSEEVIEIKFDDAAIETNNFSWADFSEVGGCCPAGPFQIAKGVTNGNGVEESRLFMQHNTPSTPASESAHFKVVMTNPPTCGLTTCSTVC